MKNWNPSRAPNAIAIRNLSKFLGRHYCRWLTKRGIGTISWVRSTDRKRTQSARETRRSTRFGGLIFHRFSSSSPFLPSLPGLSLFPAVKFITGRAATIAPSCVSRNDDLLSFGREKWWPEMVAVALHLGSFLGFFSTRR